jgi:CHASE3 domain sensor protein
MRSKSANKQMNEIKKTMQYMKEEINKTMEILKNNQSKHSTYKTSKEY